MAAPVWNLETIFAGGPAGEPYVNALERLEARAEEFVTRGDALPPLPEGLDDWSAWLLEMDDFAAQVHQASTYGHCVTCADTADKVALRASTRSDEIWSRLARAWVPVTDGVAHASEAGYLALLKREELAGMSPMLQRMRENAPLLLPRDQQSLAQELERDGINAWGQLYDRISGQLQVTLPSGQVIGSAQAQNLLSSPDYGTRAEAFGALQNAWTAVEDNCAAALSHIVGSRQVINDRRGVDELADSLARFRMTQATLDAMLEASKRAAPMLGRYLATKARLMGKEQAGWEDLYAPLPSKSSSQSWAEAQDFVETHFSSYNSELGDFARLAFRDRWVEAEDRNNKRPGAWCANVPLSGESRVFMTHGGSFRSTVTLAHELGHAYHNWVTRDLPSSQRRIPSTLAETASVFAESLVRDAALKAASPGADRLAMLDARLMAGATFLMNIPARTLFERRLYPLRREGPFDPAALRELMVSCQREAYADSLATWDPTFWASKLHFYISGFAFYNYPYTFGYLFAQLVYQRVLSEGAGFHGQYVELLRRTGWQGSEELSKEMLGLDLTDPETWWLGIKGLEEDLAAFEAEAGQG